MVQEEAKESGAKSAGASNPVKINVRLSTVPQKSAQPRADDTIATSTVAVLTSNSGGPELSEAEKILALTRKKMQQKSSD